MKLRYPIILVSLVSAASPSAYAIDHHGWDVIGTVGAIGLMGTAMGLPAYREDWEGVEQAAYSISAALGVTFALKEIVQEERPDNSDDRSFPSGHTSNSFSSATTLYRRHGWQTGVPAYAVAVFVGGTRIAADKHYFHDVLAGALIGTVSGWYFTDPINDKVQLNPWIDSKGKGGGMELTLKW
jgi:hypothetical protein